MGMREKVTRKLSLATVDKTELNRQALRLRKSFKEVEGIIGSDSKKKASK